MIAKSFNEIEWTDVEALVALRREEDDTIEFKSAFKGGSDFLSLSEAKQKAAVESVAKEVISFLNGHGGDVILGIREANNETGSAEEVSPIANVAITAERLSQSLSARIEPFQSILAVRGIVQPSGDGSSGAIVIRAPASLRAPHRSRESRECYARRGRESVPMPMDEIQDVTLNRASRRTERLSLLNEQFEPFRTGKIGRVSLPPDRMHVRCAYVPLADAQFGLSDAVRTAFIAEDPVLYMGERQFRNDVAFRSVFGNWRPTLRGKRAVDYTQHSEVEWGYSGKEIYESGIMITDFADNFSDVVRNNEVQGMYFGWLIGFFANTLVSIRNVIDLVPEWGGGILRVAILIGDNRNLITGERHWVTAHPLPPGEVVLPDFELTHPQAFDDALRQLQIDTCALAGVECGGTFSFKAPE